MSGRDEGTITVFMESFSGRCVAADPPASLCLVLNTLLMLASERMAKVTVRVQA